MTWREWLPVVVIALLVCTMIDWRSLRRGRVDKRKDTPSFEVEWQADHGIGDSPTEFSYCVYTDKYDRIIEAVEIPSRLGAWKRRRLLEHVVHTNTAATIELADLLQKGGIDSTLAASILVDHSGSMNRKAGTGPEHKSNHGFVVAADSGAVVAAGVAISVAVALENCGAAVEILGFTTREWCGGKSRQDWLKAGKPSRPGRLNDLLHIIYKRADETSISICSQRLEWLLYPPILKENIDGEAIAWARARLLARPASDRLLILVSDGAPADDSTLYENGPSYLDSHLKNVIEELSRHHNPRIVGIGIGYDVSHYISTSVAIGGDRSSLEQQLPTIANLIAGSVENQ